MHSCDDSSIKKSHLSSAIDDIAEWGKKYAMFSHRQVVVTSSDASVGTLSTLRMLIFFPSFSGVPSHHNHLPRRTVPLGTLVRVGPLVVMLVGNRCFGSCAHTHTHVHVSVQCVVSEQ